MKRVLIFYDHFSPAYKAGGPIRSLVNLVNLLHIHCKLFIFTSAKDLDGTSLAVEKDCWVVFKENVQVYYASSQSFGLTKVLGVLKSLEPDIVYINGIFTPKTVLMPLLALRLHSRKQNKHSRLVIAPRGMLQKGALSLKANKKKIYLKAFKLLGLHKSVYWHATDRQEQNDIIDFAGKGADVFTVSNVPVSPSAVAAEVKQVNELNLVTVSLIAPMKNHHFLIACLRKLPSNIRIQYDIYGSVKDAAYWKVLQQELSNLPAHLEITYKGVLRPEEVTQILPNYDCFVLPTLGENFGHAIFEAMGVGVPVLISNLTPWLGLEMHKAGWDLPLDEEKWISKLTEISKMDHETYLHWQNGAHTYSLAHLDVQKLKEQYLEMFGIL